MSWFTNTTGGLVAAFGITTWLVVSCGESAYKTATEEADPNQGKSEQFFEEWSRAAVDNALAVGKGLYEAGSEAVEQKLNEADNDNSNNTPDHCNTIVGYSNDPACQ